jgi:transcription antitermination protein NusB
MSRHSARKLVLNALYIAESSNDWSQLNPEALTKLREHSGTLNADLNHAQTIINKLLENQDALLKLLAQHIHNWEIDRLSILDRFILMIACTEMLYLDIPPKVCINEAIELAKEFSSENTPSFVNGILDAIYHAQRVKSHG